MALSAADVRSYRQRKDEISALRRRADQLEKLNDPIKDELLQICRKHGGKDRTTVFAGHVLHIKLEKGRVSWSDEFARFAGVEEHERVRNSVGTVERLEVSEAE